jgi:hypothetical protein
LILERSSITCKKAISDEAIWSSMANKEVPGPKKNGGDHISRYMMELSSGLRIRDMAAKGQLLSSVERDLKRSAGKASSYEGLVKVLGPPRELASKLSDPRNWVVQMGTPLMPKVPLGPAISSRGRLMLSVFIVSMFVVSGALFAFLPSDAITYPVMLMVSAMIYLLVSTMFYGFIGYTMTYGSMIGSGIGVEPCSRTVYDLQLLSAGAAVLLLDAGMVLYPLAGDGSAILVSVPLGVPPLLLTVAVVLMARSSRKVLPSGESHTKNKK